MTTEYITHMVNRLSLESSPYLQQHKENPVDWFPWGDEALELALKDDKPLFISIGYSTCHWCHVMARESFEDRSTADYMNKHFVSIKIDREEYPGIDKAYQEMFQMIHQRGGGWPLSVWATPDGTPFYIGTYFPNTQKHGMPSFMEVNQKLMDLWKNNRELIDQQGGRLTNALKSIGTNLSSSTTELTEDKYYKEIIHLQQRFDATYGGIGDAPKFPRVATLRFLLREGDYKSISSIVEFVSFTLHKMARGGIYDQLGGGFARYSVDREWLVPHFEKMLYDNGALIKLGAEIVATTGDKFVEFIVRDTIAWIAREMKDVTGAFYAAMNAESEGREGAFFVWSESELKDLLKEDYSLAASRFGITKEGNFEDPHHPEIVGMNVLSIHKSINQLVEALKMTQEDVIQGLEKIRGILYQAREKREKPSTDTKILTAWNCIAIRGLLSAGNLLEFPEAIQLGLNALTAITQNNLTENMVKRKLGSDSNTTGSEIDGILDDYCFLMAALIETYEITDDFSLLKQAESILELTKEKFYNPEEGIYYLSPLSERNLFNSLVQVTDDSMESGLGVLPYVLFKLGKYLEKPHLINHGDELIEKLTTTFSDYPGAISTLLNSATMYIRYPTEIVMVNPTPEIDKAVTSTYFHNRLIYRYYTENHEDKPIWKILEGRISNTKPTIYLCEGQTCSMPMYSVADWKDRRSEISNVEVQNN